MAQQSMSRRVTRTIADATGTSDTEVRLALGLGFTGAAVVAGLLAGLRVLKVLADLGTDVFNHPDREIRVPRPRSPQEAPTAVRASTAPPPGEPRR